MGNTLPQGPPGPKGPQGIPGRDGKDGAGWNWEDTDYQSWAKGKMLFCADGKVCNIPTDSRVSNLAVDYTGLNIWGSSSKNGYNIRTNSDANEFAIYKQTSGTNGNDTIFKIDKDNTINISKVVVNNRDLLKELDSMKTEIDTLKAKTQKLNGNGNLVGDVRFLDTTPDSNHSLAFLWPAKGDPAVVVRGGQNNDWVNYNYKLSDVIRINDTLRIRARRDNVYLMADNGFKASTSSNPGDWEKWYLQRE